MRTKLFSAIFLITLVAGSPLTALSWHDEGHKLTGYIAWQRMTPQTRANVIRILRAAPEDSNIAAFYQVYGIEPVNVREMEFFMTIPTWADMIRERSFPVRMRKYHNSNWHYDDTFWKEVNGKVEYLTGFEEGGMALTKLADFEKLMRDPAAKDSEKAVALAWFLHMAGDIHQPLHNSARVTDREPKGDQGGNLFLLTPEGTPREQQLNLHTFWDGITNRSVPIKKGQGVRQYLEALGDKMMKKHPASGFANGLFVSQYRKWHEEGMALATSVVFSPDLKRFEMPSEKYRKTAFATAEKQIPLAGYRIAETLNSIFGTPTPTPVVAPN